MRSKALLEIRVCLQGMGEEEEEEEDRMDGLLRLVRERFLAERRAAEMVLYT